MASQAAFAELEWDCKVAEAQPKFDDAKAIGDFPFRNSMGHSVKIVSVDPACDCVKAKVERPPATPVHAGKVITSNTFAPGEHGKIVAVFDIGARQGLHEKKIEVLTDDPKEPKVELTLKVNIPEVVQLRPTFVHWKDGEKFEARTVSVKIAPEFPLKDVKVTSSSALIRAELKPSSVAEGSTTKEYEVLITPKTERVPAQALANLHAEVNVQIEDTADHSKNYPIHVRIRGNAEIVTEEAQN
jgi:hypothetical protein